MAALTVTGRTFDYRERLKELGGLWDADAKNWRFDFATDATVEKLKQMPGCLVVQSGQAAPRAQPEPEPIEPYGFGIDPGDDKPYESSRTSVIYGDDERWFNYFKDKNPTSFFGFSNLAEMIKFIEAIPDHKRRGQRDAGWKTDDNEWYGTRNMQAAFDLVRDGWSKGVDNAARVLEFLNVEHATARRRSYGVAGGNVSIGRMLAGNPMHMIKRPKQPGRRVITLFVENTASSRIKADNLVIRAAIIAALADIMERNGYSCEIVAVTMQSHSFYNSNPAAQTAVTLKHAGEKLNLDDLVFALGHPSFLRRFNFACVSQADETQQIWRNQGYPTQAFNGYYPCGRNEFYIKHLTDNIPHGNIEEMARLMLPKVKPDKLPLEIG